MAAFKLAHQSMTSLVADARAHLAEELAPEGSAGTRLEPKEGFSAGASWVCGAPWRTDRIAPRFTISLLSSASPRTSGRLERRQQYWKTPVLFTDPQSGKAERRQSGPDYCVFRGSL